LQMFQSQEPLAKYLFLVELYEFDI
jgi:hypothetical protein